MKRIGGAGERESVSRRVRGQGGFSLIEILICVMLVGVVISALAAGMLTLMRVTQATSERQQIQVALGNYTENLLVASYVPCGAPVAVPPPSATVYNSLPGLWTPIKADMTIKVVGVEFWDDLAKGFISTCPPAGGLDQGTQRLTVEAEWRGRTGTAQVVKAYRPEPTP